MVETIKNYEAAYARMWDEIGRARRERDESRELLDTARDLVIALEHDFGDGHETKVSRRTLDAFTRLKAGLQID